jgi:hypothetical protein
MMYGVTFISPRLFSLEISTASDRLLQEIILSTDQDPFYRNQMYNNFGDLGISVKELVDDYQKKMQTHKNVQTLGEHRRL